MLPPTHPCLISYARTSAAELGVGQLRRRAVAHGLAEREVDDALDQPDPKSAVLDLLLRTDRGRALPPAPWAAASAAGPRPPARARGTGTPGAP